jgi:small subunit ribosomal protein S13
MLRIAGVVLPENKNIVIALSYLYGIGRSLALKIVQELNIDPLKKAKDLTPTEAQKLREKIEKEYKVEGDLRREVKGNIKRLIDISSYRGLRHIKHLPVRGQRTKTNSRTTRGNVRKTVGSGRRKAPDKT